MDRRLEFQMILEEALGNTNVYFQPDDNTRMVYPAIVYSLDFLETLHGNNLPYTLQKRYQVTLITRQANSAVIDALAGLRTSAFDRAFTHDGLYHTIFNIYY